MDTKVVPWMSRRDVKVIEAILNVRPMHCYEYGSGGSTVYFKDKCLSWESVESDLNWYGMVKRSGGNVRLTNDEGDYIKLPRDSYDFILVDGHARNKCLTQCLETSATVLIHDARRREYHDYVKRFLFSRKVGDDLIVMTNKIDADIINALQPFEIRQPHEKSYPWDPIHNSAYAEYCGFQM